MSRDESQKLEHPGTKKRLAIADELLAKADIKELHSLYSKAMQDIDMIGSAFGILSDHNSGKAGVPRFGESESAVQAMRDVALAAIQLAQSVATKEMQ